MYSLKAYPVLLCTYFSAVLAQQMGTSILQQIPSSSWVPVAPWLSIAFFGVLIWAAHYQNKYHFFSLGLKFSALLFLVGFFYSSSFIGYFSCFELLAKLLPVLGWAYLNQITQEKEAEKNYFLLHFLVGLSITAISFFPRFLKINGSHLWLQTAAALLCLLLAGYLGKRPIEKQPVTGPFRISYPLIAFPILLTAIQLITTLSGPFLHQKIAAIISSEQEYLTFMKNFSLILGGGTLAFSILSVWLGPFLLKTKNWNFSLRASLLILTLVSLFGYLHPHPYVFAIYHAFLNGVQYFWIFPLVQIALVKVPTVQQFSIQALVFLVGKPFLENCPLMAKTTPSLALSLSLAALALMFFLSLRKATVYK